MSGSDHLFVSVDRPGLHAGDGSGIQFSQAAMLRPLSLASSYSTGYSRTCMEEIIYVDYL